MIAYADDSLIVAPLEVQSRVKKTDSTWGWGLFSKAQSTTYSNTLALKSAELSKKSYGKTSRSINNALSRAGFDVFQSYNYKTSYGSSGKVTKGSGSAAFTIGHDVVRVGGKNKVILAVVARGSDSIAEYYGDWMKGKRRSFLGHEVWNNVWDFYHKIDKTMVAYIKRNKMVNAAAKAGNLKVLVTGHSLGGAAANMYAAKLTRDAAKNASNWAGKLNKTDIYAYTYGAIKVLTTNKNISSGYENIHNVYNWYDSFGPLGAKSWFKASHPDAKFGHTEEFDIGKKEESSTNLLSNPNHDLGTYIEAMKGMYVTCSGNQNARISPYVKSTYVYDSKKREISYVASVGEKSFKAIPSYSNGIEAFDLKMTMNGKTSVLATGTDGAFLTNARYVFFSKRKFRVTSAMPFDVYNNALYRLDMNTGKVRRVGSGVNWEAFDCGGEYLCFGRSFSAGSGSSKLWVMDIAKWQAKAVGTGISRSAKFYNGRLFCTKDTLSVPIPAVYSFNRDGSGKRIIAKNVYNYGFSGNSVVYIAFRMVEGSSYHPQFKLIRCSLAGVSKKPLSGWVDNLESLKSKHPDVQWE